MADVKNISEVMDAIELLGVSAKKVLKDGQVTVGDLPVAIELVGHADVLVKAVEGLGEIPAEVKDIDGEEAKVLLAQVFKALAAIKAA